MAVDLRGMCASAIRICNAPPLSLILPRPPPHTHLRFHQHQIHKEDHKVMLHIFVREPLAPRALCEPYIGPTVGRSG